MIEELECLDEKQIEEINRVREEAIRIETEKINDNEKE